MQPDDAIYHLSYAMYEEFTGHLDVAAEEYTSAILANPRMYRGLAIEQLRVRAPHLYKRVYERVLGSLRSHRGDLIASAELASILVYDGDLEGCQIADDTEQKLQNLASIHLSLSLCGKTQATRILELRRSMYLDPDNIEANMLLAAEFVNSPAAAKLYIMRADRAAGELTSQHSRRVWDLYHPRMVLRNDLVPQGLLAIALVPLLPKEVCTGAFIDILLRAKTGLEFTCRV